MTQADWVKEKLEERFPFGVYTDIDTDVTDETVELIQKIITLAQQRTEKKIVLGLEELANTKLGKSVYQDGIRQGIRESQKYISDLNN